MKENKEKKRGEKYERKRSRTWKRRRRWESGGNMKENGGEGREMGEVCTVQDVGRQFMRRRREDSRQLPQRNHRILPTIDQFAGYHRSSINHLFLFQRTRNTEQSSFANLQRLLSPRETWVVTLTDSQRGFEHMIMREDWKTRMLLIMRGP